MFQILYCADLRLDASFASSDLSASIGSWRRADLRATLGHILTLARERHACPEPGRRVDAVTIAGDLYEQDYALPDTADFLMQQFTKLPPTRVFIAPGECDPADQTPTEMGLYTRMRPSTISAPFVAAQTYTFGVMPVAAW